MDTNSIELAIALERISLIDTYFHVNRPTANRLQGNLAIDMPRWDYDDSSKSGHPCLNALINVGFTLSDGPAPEQITPETSGKIALTFGCLLDIAVGSPALGEAIPAGKHVVIEGGPRCTPQQADGAQPYARGAGVRLCIRLDSPHRDLEPFSHGHGYHVPARLRGPDRPN